jgi:hypothetical protein
VISGRLDALVVPLLSGASHTIRTPIDKYYVARRIGDVGDVLLPLLPASGRVENQERRLLSTRLPQSEHADVLAGHVAVECNHARLPGSVVVEPIEIFLKGISADSSFYTS